MATDGRTPALIDTSVLLNFLAIDRADLLARHPSLRFVLTDHVQGEVTDRKPERLARFEAAIAAQVFEQVSVSSLDELEVFGRLQSEGRLDIGESAAAAAAIVRGVPVATDDRRAKKILSQLYPSIQVIDTASILRDLITAGVLSLDDANAIKKDLETNHRFRLPFDRFE